MHPPSLSNPRLLCIATEFGFPQQWGVEWRVLARPPRMGSVFLRHVRVLQKSPLCGATVSWRRRRGTELMLHARLVELTVPA